MFRRTSYKKQKTYYATTLLWPRFDFAIAFRSRRWEKEENGQGEGTAAPLAFEI